MPDGKDLNGICYCTVHDACLTVKISTVSVIVLFTMPDGKDLKDLTDYLLLYCSRCLTVKISTVSVIVLFTMPDGKDLNGICYCTVHDA